MRGILADLQVLTANHAVWAEKRARMEKLIEAAAAGRDEGKGGGPLMTFHNAGLGAQVVHSGTGD
ncbi:hypothetical protein N431DRAFT_438365 [Stipitochalara longipes BDJ]|nr:hypothetical protein N431DRAFT_438365 [Stipitochalara longipes BDJ]